MGNHNPYNSRLCVCAFVVYSAAENSQSGGNLMPCFFMSVLTRESTDSEMKSVMFESLMKPTTTCARRNDVGRIEVVRLPVSSAGLVSIGI
jgi:hypothetical protein